MHSSSLPLLPPFVRLALRLLAHRTVPLAWLVVISLAVGAASVIAKPVRTDYVESELISRTSAAEPGGTLLLGLRLKMDAHWHTYWQNPGDSGMPTTIQWKLPAGFKAGQIQWPAPQRLPLPPLMNFGYEGEIVLPVEVTVPKDWPVTQVARLAARADWLVCKHVCLPGGADLELTLPVIHANPAPNAKWAALFEKSLSTVPQRGLAGAKATTANGAIELMLPGAKAAALKDVYVFPTIEGLVEPAALQGVRETPEGLVVNLSVSKQLVASEPRLAGIVMGIDARPIAFEAPMTGKLVPGQGIASGALSAPASGSANAPAEALSLGLALLFALIGGMILNLMPCVFPVLSLKILGFARSGQSGGGPGEVAKVSAERGSPAAGGSAHGGAMRIHGIAFAVGVVGSFVALAALLLGLRAAGEAVGWGFQLQSPLVVTLLALLFFLIGLNLSGVFEFGSIVPGGLAGVTLKHPIADALFSGVLAALIASPCTAPLMGAALGFALTQSTVTALMVFAVMGIGMALPYVLLSFFPGWLKRLPRPGAWLVTFKQVMAFPMYATVVWLAWVLLVQVGVDGLVWFGSALVLLSFGAWLLGRSQQATGRWAALAAILVAVVIANPPAPTVFETGSEQKAASGWEAYSKTSISAHNAAGKPVFVDFTAAWCVTCQVNKQVVLETVAVRDAFSAKHVVLMRADWTRRDPVITAALAEFGRSGVPVYALYAPGKPAVLLPEVLTKRILLDALAAL